MVGVENTCCLDFMFILIMPQLGSLQQLVVCHITKILTTKNLSQNAPMFVLTTKVLGNACMRAQPRMASIDSAFSLSVFLASHAHLMVALSSSGKTCAFSCVRSGPTDRYVHK